MLGQKKILACSAIAMGTALFLGSGNAAHAQESQGEGASERNVIIVTARKREENLLEVPLSIKAFSSEELEATGVETVRDLSFLTPGLSLVDFGAETFSAPTIRGLSQTNNVSGENNVSIFVDGVYIFNFNAVNLSLLDIERVEVVKGPVSALYGRNSFAGAINYVTKKPGDVLEGKVTGTVGTDQKYSINGAVGGPIIEDKLSVRIAAGFDTFGGTWEDAVNGRDLGGYTKRGAQFSFLANPSETFEFGGSIYYGNDKFDTPARSVLAPNCAPAGGVNRAFCGRFPTGKQNPPEAPAEIDNLNETGNSREFIHASLNGSLDVGFGTFDVLFGFNDVNFDRFGSLDNLRNGNTFNLNPGPGTINLSAYNGNAQFDRDYSIEARLSSNQDQPFRWTFGGFYYDLTRDNSNRLLIVTDTVPVGQSLAGFFPTILGGPSTSPGRPGRTLEATTQLSGFAGVDFDVTDQLTFSGEMRYSREKKSQDEILSLVSGTDTDGDGQSRVFEFFDYRVTADYQMTDDMLLYASVAHGTKAGGFNAQSSAVEDRAFGAEENITYEIGAKTSWDGGRYQLSIAAFFIDWTNLQLRTLPESPTNPGTIISNVASAAATGFEIDFQAQIADGITWSAGLAYSDPEFGDNAFDTTPVRDCLNIPGCGSNIIQVAGRNVFNLDGFSLPNQSDWEANTSLAFNGDFSEELGWFARADYAFQSKQFSRQQNFAFWGSRHLMNLRAGVETGDVTLTLFLDNVFDDTVANRSGSSTNLATFVSVEQPLLPNRRTFGVTLGAEF